MNIPKQMTSIWLATLPDNQLIELEKQLLSGFPEDESYFPKKVAYKTVLARHDRVCEELIRRGYPDPISRELIKLPSPLSSPNSSECRKFIYLLNDDELNQVREQVIIAARHAMLLMEWLDRKERRNTKEWQQAQSAMYHLFRLRDFITKEKNLRAKRKKQGQKVIWDCPVCKKQMLNNAFAKKSHLRKHIDDGSLTRSNESDLYYYALSKGEKKTELQGIKEKTWRKPSLDDYDKFDR